MEIVQFSRPISPARLRPKFSHPLDFGRPISNKPPLQMITNQLQENMVQR